MVRTGCGRRRTAGFACMCRGCLREESREGRSSWADTERDAGEFVRSQTYPRLHRMCCGRIWSSYAIPHCVWQTWVRFCASAHGAGKPERRGTLAKRSADGSWVSARFAAIIPRHEQRWWAACHLANAASQASRRRQPDPRKAKSELVLSIYFSFRFEWLFESLKRRTCRRDIT